MEGKAIVPAGLSWGLGTGNQARTARPRWRRPLELRVCTSMIMPKAPFQPPACYEAALEELEQLVSLIESGQLPLEQLLTGYQRGAELLQFCRDRLQAVENQIKVLDEGTLKPWTQE